MVLYRPRISGSHARLWQRPATDDYFENPPPHRIQHGGIADPVARNRRRLTARNDIRAAAHLPGTARTGSQLRDHALAGYLRRGSSWWFVAGSSRTPFFAETLRRE